MPTEAAAGIGNTPRYFECVEEGASKFWELRVDGTEMTVRWGKIGTNGQLKKKTFATAEVAVREAAKLMAEKTSKGYREGTVGS